MSEGLRKELVSVKEQMERTIVAYEKRFEEMLAERLALLDENE